MNNVKTILKRDKLNLWIVAKNVNNPPIKNLPYNDDTAEDDLEFFIGIPDPAKRAKGQIVCPFPVFSTFKNVYNDDAFVIDFVKRNMQKVLDGINRFDSVFPGYCNMVHQRVQEMVQFSTKINQEKSGEKNA